MYKNIHLYLSTEARRVWNIQVAAATVWTSYRYEWKTKFKEEKRTDETPPCILNDLASVLHWTRLAAVMGNGTYNGDDL